MSGVFAGEFFGGARRIAQEILSQRITKNCKEMIKPAVGEEAEVEELVPAQWISDNEERGDEEWNEKWDDEENTRGKW